MNKTNRSTAASKVEVVKKVGGEGAENKDSLDPPFGLFLFALPFFFFGGSTICANLNAISTQAPCVSRHNAVIDPVVDGDDQHNAIRDARSQPTLRGIGLHDRGSMKREGRGGRLTRCVQPLEFRVTVCE